MADPFPGGGWDPLNWIPIAVGKVTDTASSWFKDLAGKIASGIEAGFVAALGDVWKVLVGPLEILGGALLIVIALGIAFRHDVAGLAAGLIK
jgi:hypothetical protein